jgi:uncharacterized membrane protein
MANCKSCGAVLTEGSAFCGSCGGSVASTAPAMPVGQQVATVGPAVGAAGLTSNVAGALAYVLGLITGILFLVLEPYKRDRFVRFHAMQSILFCAAAIVFRIAWGILVNVLIDISGWTAVVLVPVGLIISIGLFLFWLFVMFQAYNQREFRIPIIGAIAAKQLG